MVLPISPLMLLPSTLLPAPEAPQPSETETGFGGTMTIGGEI